MRLSLRFLIPLMLALVLIAWVTVPLVDRLAMRWFVNDLNTRALLVANGMGERILELASERNEARIQGLFLRAMADEKLHAFAFCDATGQRLYVTASLAADVSCSPAPASMTTSQIFRLEGKTLHIVKTPVVNESGRGELILVQDMSFIERRINDAQHYVWLFVLVIGVIVATITVLIAELSWRGWVASVRNMIRGRELPSPAQDRDMAPELMPVLDDLRDMMRELDQSRHAGEDATAQWHAEKLRSVLQDVLSGDEIIVLSNREPYSHVYTPQGIRVKRPASGLVTAVEPVMRACSGTWIAHGSGDADRATVDQLDHVAVPPEQPFYTLRRIWLTPEEEQGYYYGLANEGLWPLCHIAHVRPVFRAQDWEQYVKINQHFADAVMLESTTPDPVVLIQDYHFALAPRMIRALLPRATIITFWHIPWPNQEIFGICPWREQLLDGLLGSTILGFHTPQHCKNFIETVDRYMETRIEHETMTISYKSQLTRVEAYPISIDWNVGTLDESTLPNDTIEAISLQVRQKLGVAPDCLLAIGVDRLDYTKGIVERLEAVERMLQLHPELASRFVFVQIGAPTRSALEEYKQFESRVKATVDRINGQYQSSGHEPVRLLAEHHDTEAVYAYYRASDVCLVTSLHDGMNLVAKEFVSARDDEAGVLLLSQFAGAARELHEALIINPYDREETALALYQALTMPHDEQRERMRALRASVKDFNIYRWAGRMLLDAARLRQRERVAARLTAYH